MTVTTDPALVLDHLAQLLEGYSSERRTTTQPFQLAVAARSADYRYHPDDELVREPLLEHVGSLPVVATALHPHVGEPDVDLGRALIMLAVHDIGELGTGDEMTFTKGPDGAHAEREAALGLLDRSQHAVYDEMETRATVTARFANSVDKLTPDVFDLLTPPEVTVERYRHYVGVERDGIVDLIVRHKRPHMAWNPFLVDLHDDLAGRLRDALAAG